MSSFWHVSQFGRHTHPSIHTVDCKHGENNICPPDCADIRSLETLSVVNLIATCTVTSMKITQCRSRLRQGGCYDMLFLSLPFLSLPGMCYRIISYHIIAYHIISYHIISYHIISYHIISYRIVSYRIIAYHIISYHATILVQVTL